MRSLAIVSLLALAGLFAYLLMRGDSANAGVVVERDVQVTAEEASSGILAAPPHSLVEVTSGGRVTQAPVGALAGAVDPPPAVPAREATLTVSVEDRERGGPLVGVPVFLDLGEPLLHTIVLPGEFGGVGVAVLTDETGTARLHVPLGQKLRLFARGSCFTLGSDELAEPLSLEARSLDPFEAGEQRQEFLFVGSVDAKLHLRIVDREHAQPIRGAEVLRGERVCATSDGSGVALYDLCDGAYDSIEVRAFGYGPVYLTLLMRREGPDAPFVVELERSATLRGRVLGLDRPMQAKVRLSTDGHRLIRPTEMVVAPVPDKNWTAELDADGAFELTGIAPEVPLVVRLREEGGEYRSLQAEALYLDPGELREIEWRLAEFGSIEGRLVDEEGNPLEGFEILMISGGTQSGFATLGSDSITKTRSDASGAFRFDDFQAGSYTIALAEQKQREPEERYACAQSSVELESGVASVELVAQRGVFLRGRVLTPDGAGAADLFVLAFQVGSLPAFAMSGQSGRFAIGPLTRGDHYILAHSPPMSPYAAPAERLVAAPASGIEIQLVKGAMVAGRVIDAQTGAAVASDTSVQQAFGHYKMSNSSMGGQIGFRYEGLQAGTYHLIAEAPDGRVGVLRNITLDTGEKRTDLEIPVGPAGELRITYTGSLQGTFLRVRSDDVVFLDSAPSPGEKLRCRVPLGMFTVEVTRTSGITKPDAREVYATRIVEVRDGALIDVVME